MLAATVSGGWGAGDWLAVAAVLQVVVLLVAALYAGSQVREARRLRAAHTRPFVVVTFETSNVARHLIDLVVENIGQTPAKDVSIEFSPRLQSTMMAPADSDRIYDWVALKEGIPYLAPRQRLSHLVENAISRYNEASTLPRKYEVTVSYSEVIAPKGKDPAKHSEHYVLDIGVWYGSHYIGEKGVHDIGESLDKMATTFSRWTEELNGLRVYTVDLEKHRAERYALMDEQLLAGRATAGDGSAPPSEDGNDEAPRASG